MCIRDRHERGRLDRSLSPSGPSSRYRRHHFHAVARETPISSATCATGRPRAIRSTMINLPCTVNGALPCICEPPRDVTFDSHTIQEAHDINPPSTTRVGTTASSPLNGLGTGGGVSCRAARESPQSGHVPTRRAPQGCRSPRTRPVRANRHPRRRVHPTRGCRTGRSGSHPSRRRRPSM